MDAILDLVTEEIIKIVNMETEKLENPFIRVIWEDIPGNFTKERLRRVKSYFQKKYNSKNVTVVTKSQSVDGEELKLGLDTNIMDPNYQKTLLKEFIENEKMDVKWANLSKLDDKVNTKLDEIGKLHNVYRALKIKKITFSNFLSFGDNNHLEFDNLNGITVIDSDPPNYGGKTVLAVDLLLFLFFNSTTKTTRAEEIFNKFRDKNEVSVQGDVEIDGDNYVILRKIIRKKTKKGDWSVKTSLDFFKKLKDGSLQNFTGEQRRETEKFIKEAIGNVDDFLLTILTTGSNLESLIDAKATERGNIFYRFIGLELLREKEKVCKNLYNTWSKTLISNLNDIETLKQESDKLKVEIEDDVERINKIDHTLDRLNSEITKLEEDKDEILSSRYSDIDEDVVKLDYNSITEEIGRLSGLIENKKEERDSIMVKEPTTYINTIELEQKRESLSNKKLKFGILNNEITSKEKNIIDLQNSEICPVCKRDLDDVDHTNEISNLKKELEDNKVKLKNIKIDLENDESELKILETLKSELDSYDKNKLIKEKKVLEIESLRNTRKDKNTLTTKYESNQKKIEHNKKVEIDKLKIQSTLDNVKLDKNNKLDHKNTIKIKYEQSKRILEDNLSKIETIKKEEQIQRIFKTYLTAFGKNGIPKVILKSLMPVINGELSHLLSDDCTFDLEVKVNEKNEIDFWMIDKETHIPKPLTAGSGYEKTVSSLALRAILSKFSSLPKPNVTVFDEVFGKVSNENLHLVKDFFLKLKEYFDCVFLITHNPLVTEWGDNLITVKKSNNVSKI
jgi:DNA repair exonuclease SbcCD ATPase subunit